MSLGNKTPAQRDSCTLYDPRRFVIECAHGVRESISWRPNWPFYFRARDRGAKFFSRSHSAVIHVYDAAGNVIETHESVVSSSFALTAVTSMLCLLSTREAKTEVFGSQIINRIRTCPLRLRRKFSSRSRTFCSSRQSVTRSFPLTSNVRWSDKLTQIVRGAEQFQSSRLGILAVSEMIERKR